MTTSIFRKDSLKFDGTNYSIWKIGRETHLNYIGRDIWEVTNNGYVGPTPNQPNPPTLGKDQENDCKAREALLSALSNQQIMRLSDQSTTKAIWDKLGTFNEGDTTVKIVILECFRVRYENLKMEEDERISSFMEKVNEVVLGIQYCGGYLSEDEIVSKVLRALPLAYKMKVTAINELRTMPNTSVSRDTLVRKLSTLELEEFGPDATIKTNLAFRASSSNTFVWKTLYAKELEDIRRKNEELEELEALFARKMPKGLVGSKYEGKTPFKCFNCNKVGHMTSRCPDKYARLIEEAKRTYKPNPEY
ncbi:hypothetical protein SUGI_0769570 [Cryptomeria japonica]|nr:hypothetical protein SUGI_0769570 [Cryptomeria japonica]